MELISLEKLYPLIHQEIEEKQYLPLLEFIKANFLEPNVKSVIIEYLQQNYQGKTDENARYFFTTNLLKGIRTESCMTHIKAVM